MKRDLIGVECEYYELLHAILQSAQLKDDCNDVWQQRFEKFHSFLVNSCYLFLLDCVQRNFIDNDLQVVLDDLWQPVVPTIVGVLKRLLLRKFPTRDDIVSKGIITDVLDTSCPLCFEQEESVCHLFFLCRHTKTVWHYVQSWLGLSVDDLLVGAGHFKTYRISCKSKVWHRYNLLLWVATTWCIWIHNNNVIFRGTIFDRLVVSNHVKSLSWGWFVSNVGCKFLLTFRIHGEPTSFFGLFVIGF